MVLLTSLPDTGFCNPLKMNKFIEKHKILININFGRQTDPSSISENPLSNSQ
jgi:hypothetical protein